jgi:hypothetical protein
MLEFMQSHPRLVDVVLALSTGILIAAVSAWITVQLSLRRFRTERWWERKVEAYERIIGALHDAKAFADTHLHAGLEQRDVPDEIAEELRGRSRTAHAELLKAVDLGAFLLPDEALSRLRRYRKEESEAADIPDWFGHLEADWKAANDCLKDLIQLAKRDLRAE